MKISIPLITTAALFLAGMSGHAMAEQQRLFVTVTGTDVQDRAMPLVLANQVLDQGAEVRVLLCGAGGHLALAGYEAERFAPRDITPVDLLNRLMANGATVEVCAIFLPNSGHSADELREGIGIASPPDVATWMMSPGTRLFSH